LRLAFSTWTRTVKTAPGPALERDGLEIDRSARSGFGGVRVLAAVVAGSAAKQTSNSATNATRREIGCGAGLSI
jgi:hypothetical protein